MDKIKHKPLGAVNNIILSLPIFAYVGEAETGRSYQNFRYLPNKVWINRYFCQFESTSRNEDESFHP